MDESNIRLHQYRDGVMVEVIIDHGNGNVSALSVEFDLINPSEKTLTPREELPDEYSEKIRGHIEDSEFTLAMDR